ncbi:hypothetical protein P3G55_00495 [Leptospira sp. 96542]|nr:hypothetical protein [Leptospira sp. 96542]
MKQLLFGLFCFMIVFCKDQNIDVETKTEIKEPIKTNSVRMSIQWEYTNFPLEMKIYELSGSVPMTVWTTATIPQDQKSPIGKEIEDGEFLMKPGTKKQFLLVAKNDLDKEIYFFAAPHSALPVEHSFGFKFKCLCVNHAFFIPPKHFWYRVVEIRTSPDFLGDHLTLRHNLIGISKARMNEFTKASKETIHSEHE